MSCCKPDRAASFAKADDTPHGFQIIEGKCVDAENRTAFCLKKDLCLCEPPADYTVKKEDGTDFLQITVDQDRRKMSTMDGTVVCQLILATRLTEVYAAGKPFALPHVFIYTTKAYKAGQPKTELFEGDSELYTWARVAKTSQGSSRQYTVAFADWKGGPGGEILEMFDGDAYSGVLDPNDRVSINRKSSTVLLTEDADFKFDCEDCYKVKMKKHIDQVLMIATVMSMEFLRDR
mmetsp:Transcript_41981/g.130110  ORF Transcript_41981/g.130110 Transcript_41981/m.130110 type:complete len:234 (-) Transcript_41981:32-733(-)